MSDLSRLTRIASRQARRHGAKAAVYASATRFDVLCEKWVIIDGERRYVGMHWVKRSVADAYRAPGALARSIRQEIRGVFTNG